VNVYEQRCHGSRAFELTSHPAAGLSAQRPATANFVNLVNNNTGLLLRLASQRLCLSYRRDMKSMVITVWLYPWNIPTANKLAGGAHTWEILSITMAAKVQ